MKKFIFTAVLLLSVSVTYAQFNLGVKFGYNSSLSFSNLNTNYSFKDVKSEIWNNFQAGVFARVSLPGKLYLQPELLYSMQKNNYQLTVKDANTSAQAAFENTMTVSTVEVPVLLGYKVLDLKLASLRLLAGPKIQFNAGSSLDYKNITSGSTITGAGLWSDVKKANIGLQVGAGVDVLMFTLDARYNLISNVYEPKVNDIKLSSNTFVISLGWKIF